MNRRHFVISSAAAASASFASSAQAAPSDTLHIAVVGLRGQGNSRIRAYSGMKDVEIAALCDIDESILDKRLMEVEGSGRKRPARYVDIRQVLEKEKDIDCISIATPNHNHT